MEPVTAPRPHASLRHDDGRLVRGRRSRAKIRGAARALFRERGFDATTLRAIAARAGMGASSIYRHIRSKEELLIDELADLQDRAWRRFRVREDRTAGALERLHRFLDAEQELLAVDPDFTLVAIRATTHPEARVAARVLQLQDRTIGLLAEILQAGRTRGELRRDADVVAAARALAYATNGARLAWANGQLDAVGCREAVASAARLLFEGVARPAGAAQPPEA